KHEASSAIASMRAVIDLDDIFISFSPFSRPVVARFRRGVRSLLRRYLLIIFYQFSGATTTLFLIND
ncbi:MAG: hypothetical protein II739_08990, partial [Clostridia bacterium]|nr:hypothetical protein [Clostridia bacterium]